MPTGSKDVVMSGHNLYTNTGDRLFYFEKDVNCIRVGEDDEGALSPSTDSTS